jgi:2-polyprenyl-6-methoxyphenol hydroxylase-like FAD-dependent oxidoreductase
LLARILGQEGHDVQVYEYRDDPRRGVYKQGRSINLALSTRGRAALAAAGVEDVVMKTAIPMRGRMLHAIDGSRKEVLYDPEGGQCVYSVSRQYLNEILLSEAETCPGVRIQFNHKLLDADFLSGMTKFQ